MESRLLVTVLFPNFSDQLFKLQIINSSSATFSNQSMHFSDFAV